MWRFWSSPALRSLGRKTRMMAQLVGAIGLTCTAPAAYYIGTGRLSERAFVLWAANWIFAGNQIHFVQLRIQSARASTFSQKFARGKIFFLAQLAFFASLVVRIVLARTSSLGDRRFCSGTHSRNTVVLSKAGISGCQEPRLVRDEARIGIWNSACCCFHLLVRGHLHCSGHNKGRHKSIPVPCPRG